MSLINQMLKDLESRQSQKLNEKNSAVSGLTPARDKKQPLFSKKFLLISIPVLLISLYLGWSDLKTAHEKKKALEESLAAKQTTQVDTNEVASAAHATAAALTAGSAIPENGASSIPVSHEKPQELFNALVKDSTAPSLKATHPEATLPEALDHNTSIMNEMTDVKINITDTMASIDMSFKSAIYYDFERNPEQHAVTIKLFNIQLNSQALNNFPNNAFIQSIKVEHINNDSVILVTTRPDVEMVSLDAVQAGDKAMLSLKFQQHKYYANSVSGSMQKVAVPLTQDQLAEKTREDAIALVESEKIEEAVALLTQSLSTFPAYRPTRETLAIILMDQNQPDAAEALLNAGLLNAPRYVPFLVLKARILLAKGNYDEALNVLQTVTPNIKEEPGYFAILAGLQQQKGNYGAAEQTYRQLVSMQPDNGMWWMGYAVALENGGQQNRAKEAYKQAIVSGTLSPTLQIYANDRITLLGGGE